MTDKADSITALSPEAIVRLVTQQAAILDQLEAIGPEQTQALDRADVAGLDALIRQRQRLIAELQRLDDDLAAVREQWSVIAARLDAETRERIGATVRRGLRLRDRLVQRDAEDMARIRRLRDGSRQQTARMAAGARVASAYRPPTDDVRRYTDRNG